MAYKDDEKRRANNRKKIKRKLGTPKHKVRDRVRHAVADGRLVKPKNCSLCSKTGKIEGHHEDYEKVFEVLWVCSKCHREIHKDLFIESGGTRGRKVDNGC